MRPEADQEGWLAEAGWGVAGRDNTTVGGAVLTVVLWDQ